MKYERYAKASYIASLLMQLDFVHKHILLQDSEPPTKKRGFAGDFSRPRTCSNLSQLTLTALKARSCHFLDHMVTVEKLRCPNACASDFLQRRTEGHHSHSFRVLVDFTGPKSLLDYRKEGLAGDGIGKRGRNVGRTQKDSNTA